MRADVGDLLTSQNLALSLRGIGQRVGRKPNGSASRILVPACAVLLGAAAPAADTGAAAPSLAIVLRPETDAAGKVVGVTVEQRIVPGGTPRALSLSAPLRFAGFVPVATVVADLDVADANGRVGMGTTDLTTPDHGPTRRWTSTRAVAGTVTVRYRLPLTPFAQGGPPFGVKAAGLGIGGNSGSLLVLPDLPRLARSTIGWDLSRMAPGSRAVMAGGEGTVTVEGPPDALLDRWLLAGPLLPGQAMPGPGFNAYALGTPPFAADAMMTWSRRAYGVLADAFGYLGRPSHLLLIRALDAPSHATGTASAERQASLITVGSPTYLPGQDEAGVRTTIAHEMTHQWVGSFGDSASPWFTEGLTVYASVTLPCEAGLQPWSECAAEINDWAKAYYASEARDWPLERIEATPFAREDVRRVPYGRGMMYFANLDASIRASSDGRRTLLTALRPLFERRRNGIAITVARWETWLRREQGNVGVALFRRTVLGGAIITPSPAAFSSQLTATSVRWTDQAKTYDGFAWQVAFPITNLQRESSHTDRADERLRVPVSQNLFPIVFSRNCRAETGKRKSRDRSTRVGLGNHRASAGRHFDALPGRLTAAETHIWSFSVVSPTPRTRRSFTSCFGPTKPAGRPLRRTHHTAWAEEMDVNSTVEHSAVKAAIR